MSRSVVGFLVAPLAVPVVLLPYFGTLMPTSPGILFASEISAVIAYVGMVVFGIPIYFILQAMNWTAFWIWLVVGFAVGGIMWYVFAVLFAILLGEGLSAAQVVFTDPVVSKGVLWPGGPSGILVGVIFWLIARPDRASATKTATK